MHIILGGTGQVGSATAHALLDRGETVTIVTRAAVHGAELKKHGAQVAEVDLRDVDTLRDLFRTGKRAFLLNPPADPSGDTDAEERRNVAAIIEALQDSGLEKVVAQSTYGAFEGERCGDLTVLYELEQSLLAQPIPAAINRGGYYMSNWAGMIGMIKETGTLPSFFPADLILPMVAPSDLGREAARRMMTSVSDTGIQHVEGPARYSAPDVARALADLLDRDVEVQEIPSERLEETFGQFGFSEAAAASYACMTRRLIAGKTDTDDEPIRGKTSLDQYLKALLSIS